MESTVVNLAQTQLTPRPVGSQVESEQIRRDLDRCVQSRNEGWHALERFPGQTEEPVKFSFLKAPKPDTVREPQFERGEIRSGNTHWTPHVGSLNGTGTVAHRPLLIERFSLTLKGRMTHTRIATRLRGNPQQIAARVVNYAEHLGPNLDRTNVVHSADRSKRLRVGRKRRFVKRLRHTGLVRSVSLE